MRCSLLASGVLPQSSASSARTCLDEPGFIVAQLV